MTEGLGRHLDRFGHRHRIHRQLAAAHIVAVARRFTDGQFTVQSFRTGTLTLRVATQVTRRLVERRRNEIIQAINAALRRPLVERLRFHVGGDP